MAEQIKGFLQYIREGDAQRRLAELEDRRHNFRVRISRSWHLLNNAVEGCGNVIACRTIVT